MNDNNKISVFGGSGFIGSNFCNLYPNETIKIDRDDYNTKSNNILYFISTVDNYNVHKDIHIDIDTNLTVLMNVLENIPIRHSYLDTAKLNSYGFKLSKDIDKIVEELVNHYKEEKNK